MPFHRDDPLQTMARAYREICKGREPWVELGNFMNEWFAYAVDRRPELVAERVEIPGEATRKQRRWAAFIAASVEYLCERYGVPCPEWVHDPYYTLERTWWYCENASYPSVRKWLLETTPEPFVRRNIYCGDNVYANKWELAEMAAKIREMKAQKTALQEA